MHQSLISNPCLFVRKFFCVRAGIVGDDLAGADQLPFVNHEAFQADRTASVNLVRANAQFGAKAIAIAIAKTGAAIPKDIG